MYTRTKYTINRSGVPDEKLWEDGWAVSFIVMFLGFYILRYRK